MVHRVEQAHVAFNQPPPNDFHRSRHANARFVVAVDVGAHRQFGLFFSRHQQLLNVLGIQHRIAGPPRSAADRTRFHPRPLHAHKHFRGRPDQLLPAQLQNEFVWRWAGLLNGFKQLRRAPGIRSFERLPQDHFVEVPLLHSLPDRLHIRHVLFARVVAGNRRRFPLRRFRHGLPFTRQPQRRHTIEFEFVLESLNLFLLAIHVINVVAEEQV